MFVVYFVEIVGGDAVLVGFSTDPVARFYNIKSQLGRIWLSVGVADIGRNVRLLWLFRGDKTTEKYLHYQFQNHRLRPPAGRGRPGAEWFALSAVRDAFRYYGADPDTLTPSDGKQVLAGELPEGLLPPPGWGRRARRRRGTRGAGHGAPPTESGWWTVVEVQEDGCLKCQCRCGFVSVKTPGALRRSRSCSGCREAEAASR